MDKQADANEQTGTLVMARTGFDGDGRPRPAARSTSSPGQTASGFSIDFSRPESLSAADLDEIDNLVTRYFLESKGWIGPAIEGCDRVIRYRSNDGGELAGISLLVIDDLTHKDRRVRVLYTRAVMLREYARGRNLIQLAGLQSFLRFGLTFRRSVYWFTECDTFRSYLLGMRNLKSAWPRVETPMPAFERGLYDYLCKKNCGEFWNATRRVRTPISGRRMAPHLLSIPARLLRDPDIAFYVRMNPRHQDGDSLPILATLDFKNIFCIVKRAWARLRRRTRTRRQAAPAPNSLTE